MILFSPRTDFDAATRLGVMLELKELALLTS